MTTKAEKSDVAALFPFAMPFPDRDAARMMTRPWEQWLRFQADMLKTGGPLLSGWLDRQRQTSETAIKALERLSQCADLAEMAAIQQAFLDEQMRHWGTDIQAAAEQVLALSQTTMTAAKQAAEISADLAKLPANVAIPRPRPAKAAE